MKLRSQLVRAFRAMRRRKRRHDPRRTGVTGLHLVAVDQDGFAEPLGPTFGTTYQDMLCMITTSLLLINSLKLPEGCSVEVREVKGGGA